MKPHLGNKTPESTYKSQDQDLYAGYPFGWRLAEIKKSSGEVIFSRNVYFPTAWSDTAVNIVAEKYFYGKNDSPIQENDLRQLIDRQVDAIAQFGGAHKYFKSAKNRTNFRRDLKKLLIEQKAFFNSPVNFNCGIYPKYIETKLVPTSAGTGWHWDFAKNQAVPDRHRYEHPQCSACFINSVDDSIASIMATAAEEALIFKGGSGAGKNLSRLRSSKETVSGGGHSSGPVSFMKGYDAFAGVIKSAGANRRAAKLECLDVDHLDIEEFVWCKAKEERKAHALIDSGRYNSNLDGDAYTSVFFQNSNISVRVSDEFMEAAENDKAFFLKGRNGQPIEEIKAKDLLMQIARAAWECGDPGMQYDTTINKWHTSPKGGRIRGSNPCCLVGSTLIITDAKGVPIEKLKKMFDHGEQLPLSLSFDEATGKPALKKITKVWISGTTIHLTQVVTKHGLSFLVTPEERFLLHDGRYVQANSLEVGQVLRSLPVTAGNYDHADPSEDSVSYVAPVVLDEPVNVYDMEIEDLHNFGISSHNGHATVIVHNSEYMFLDNTSCNLASINLLKFLDVETGAFDQTGFEHAIDVLITAMDILVDLAGYPTQAMAENSHQYRPLGLGYCNLGSLLMSLGLPYDSPQGRMVAGAITSLLCARAYWASSTIARQVGPAPQFEENAVSFRKVIQQHGTASDALRLKMDGIPQMTHWAKVAAEAHGLWLGMGASTVFRNHQVTVLAPTGTIGFAMDASTTGMEPELALVKYKYMVGGGSLKLVNTSVMNALRSLGYSEKQTNAISEALQNGAAPEDCPGLKQKDIPVFDTSLSMKPNGRCISWRGHIDMMAAVQPFLSGSLSKTINVNNNTTVEEIYNIYFDAWKKNLKCVSIYRDGCKLHQPLSTTSPNDAKSKAGDGTEPKKVRERPPMLQGPTLAVDAGKWGKVYVTVNYDPETKHIAEVFIRESASNEAWELTGRLISLLFRAGVSKTKVLKQLRRTEGTHVIRYAFPGDKGMKTFTSIAQAVAYVIDQVDKRIINPASAEKSDTHELEAGPGLEEFCRTCGGLLVPSGTCKRCVNCGETTGCS